MLIKFTINVQVDEKATVLGLHDLRCLIQEKLDEVDSPLALRKDLPNELSIDLDPATIIVVEK